MQIETTPEIEKLSKSITAQVEGFGPEDVTVRVTSPYGEFVLQIPTRAHAEDSERAEYARVNLHKFALAFLISEDVQEKYRLPVVKRPT